MPFPRSVLLKSLVFASVTLFAEASIAQQSDSPAVSTHVGGSTAASPASAGTSGPMAPSDMHAPTGPTTGGSTSTGKTSHTGRLSPRHMHAPTGPTMGGSVGTAKTGGPPN